MPKESYAKIWTTIGLLTLYTSLNMYLYIQGSEMAFKFPDFSKAGRQSISLYSMLIFIPAFLTFLWVTNLYLKEHNQNRSWTESFPIAFNLKFDPSHGSGKKYQIFFFIAFFIIPVLLQIHSLKKFFRTPVFLRTNSTEIVANNFKEHLTKFVPFKDSFQNMYRFGDPLDNPVTFFPGYESWFFLLLEILILVLVIRLILNVNRISKQIKQKNDAHIQV